MNLPDNVVEVDKVQGVGFGHGKLRISRRLLNLKLWLLQMMQTHSLGMESWLPFLESSYMQINKLPRQNLGGISWSINMDMCSGPV